MIDNKIITHGSLFSGIGGFDLAAKWVGWRNIFNCEIDKWCRDILKFHFKNTVQYEDVKRTDFTSWEGRIDVLSTGFPCQPFSLAGKRKGAADDRYLWPEMIRAIREIRPTWIIGENVGGIISMVQPGSEVTVEDQGSLFDESYKETILEQQFVVDTIINDLEQERYSVQPIVIPVCAVGAPHRRDRVWFVARRIQDNNDQSRARDNCRQGGLQLPESVEMENKQFGICLQNNQSKGRWQEMEDYLNAQIDLLSGKKRGDRPYKQKQVRQQKVEFKNSCTLGELSQSFKRNGCEKTKRTEQMVCSNLCEQQKDSFGMLRDKRGSDECENQCRKNTVAYRAKARPQSVQREGEDGVYQSEIATDSNGDDAGRSEHGEFRCQTEENKREEGKREWIRCNTERIGEGRATSDPQRTGRRQVRQKIQSEQSNGNSINSSCSKRNVTDTHRKQLEDSMRTWNWLTEPANPYCKRTWSNFPTQSPVCRGNDGLPFDVDDLTISFTKWRTGSVKGYGNAIVPQVAFEIFKGIDILIKES